MKSKKRLFIAALTIGSIGLIGAGIVYANSIRSPVEFFVGHTHDSEGTHGAPSHSGGTDRRGCHNASVPYHCH